MGMYERDEEREGWGCMREMKGESDGKREWEVRIEIKIYIYHKILEKRIYIGVL